MRFYIDQHGCAKNQVDGEEIYTRLISQGHTAAPSADEAEIILVNTCGFIESAKKESIDAVLQIKASWPEKKILLMGCLAQRYPSELYHDLPETDGIVGNSDLSLVSEAVLAIESGKRPEMTVPQPPVFPGSYIERTRFFDFPGTAHIKITEGCSNHCSFCAIPLIRGELRSRTPESIVGECVSLIERGVRELVLIGQDLGSYGKDLGSERVDLPRLLGRLSEIEGDFRIRVLYIHPDHFPETLLGVMQKDARILAYFDLPFQHASERILRSMNRRGNAERYLGLVNSIRSSLPDAMIRSTFMVGFPGESDEDFAILRDFQDRSRLDWLGVFEYSREDGTPAYSMKPIIRKKIAHERRRALEDAQGPITEKRLSRFLGTTTEIFIEENVENEDLSLGRTWFQAPEVDGTTVVAGNFPPGKVIRGRVVGVHGVDVEVEQVFSTDGDVR
jgi:ribosomal protein S12 methylthiotransferase